jgi:mannose-6-phosphate isomerase-like protein (cupin superfamily)
MAPKPKRQSPKGQSPKGLRLDIESKTISNKAYRRVIYTDDKMQVVLMSLKPKEEIGMEVHKDATQFIRVERGKGKAVIAGKTHLLRDGVVVIIPFGTLHNIINASSRLPMKLYTVYSPPTHPPGTLEMYKKD